MYINCHSHYSLRYGTFSEVDLLELAIANKVSYLALTDINNTSACINFIRRAEERNIKPLVGIEFKNGPRTLYVGIAKNNEGFRELNSYLSRHLEQKLDFPDIADPFQNAFIIYPYQNISLLKKNELRKHEYIGIGTKDINKLLFSKQKFPNEKLVALQPVTFRDKKDFNTHRLLRAIDNNILLSRLPKEEQACFSEKMIPEEDLKSHYDQCDYIINNTIQLQKQCSITFNFSKERPSLNKATFTKSSMEDQKLLKKLCKEKIRERYKNLNYTILRRLVKELSLITSMGFVSYFLINWRIISYAREKNYYYVGRGSGANSIVAYILRITDVDPIDLDLYFERFINSHRTSPPDFDIDFSWKDRPDMTKFIFDEFGGKSNRVALLGTYITFQYKGAVRELGKVFGLPKYEIDQLSIGSYTYKDLDQMNRLVLNYARYIQGMPNYVSIHASGILISEKPIHYYSATNLPPKGFQTVQFDMIIAEDIGLYKFDILGQRGLAKIKDTLDIIKYNQPEKANFDIHAIDDFKKDPKINALIRNADCMGCFYIESPAMRMLLSKLKTDTYTGLVAASSIIRPGVAKSGMMREYIMRVHNPDRIQNSHPILQELMHDTYGIMVYQEDVIKVAHIFAKLTLDEADVLRRGMSGKFRSRKEFTDVHKKFISNCKKEGYEDAVTNEIWEQVASFAGYAFPKGHSASYAVESYQSLHLKAYFPLEYLVATVNNGGGFYSSEIYLHEISMIGGVIELPCINISDFDHILKKNHVFIGLKMLRNLDQHTIDNILKERDTNGNFTSLDNFIDRLHITIEQLSILIKIECFRFTGKNIHELLWEAHVKLNVPIHKDTRQSLLFSEKRCDYTLPSLEVSALESAFEQIEAFGFPLCGYFKLLETPPVNRSGAMDIQKYLNNHIDIYGYLITLKNTKMHKGEQMMFGTFLDQYGKVFDTVIFPPVASKYKFRGKGIYRLYGKVTEEFSFISIEVLKLRKEAYIPDARYADTEKSTIKIKV
ncbi:DNA polymerase III subunit alpha [Aquimarina sp. ERC-38]|uniref:DNA polymerase III subunit alpha n=1 Tax=Aquimarina sp. ERC-38 TaxID=2949996 RepID=UPI002246B29C|nr:DNA polymerase III subunit alpha [Aquimarina sp. ERC-38]UZO79443.1 DNA polymerase III subunit alpha [Aquimarina sp. ERC-38]